MGMEKTSRSTTALLLADYSPLASPHFLQNDGLLLLLLLPFSHVTVMDARFSLDPSLYKSMSAPRNREPS